MAAAQDLDVTPNVDQASHLLLDYRTTSPTTNTRDPSPSSRSEIEVSPDPNFPRQSQDDTESSSVHRRRVSLESSPGSLGNIQYGSVSLLAPWFPEVDSKNERAQTWRTWHSRQDVLLLTATAISTFVFIVNLVATIVSQVKYKPNRGVVPIYEGSCSFVKRVDIMVHVFINLLSSLLLGASNLCMQILVAPTRRETDEAHRKKRWLDIGVPSWRNLKSIRRVRLLMWCCLSVSSIPLHFIYNSAISISIPRYSYAAAVVSENFLHGAPWVSSGGNIPWAGSWPSGISWDPYWALVNLSNIALDSSRATNLTTRQCLETYSDAYGDRTNMLIVTEDDPTSMNGSLLEYAYLPATWHQGDIYWPCYNGSPEYDIQCDRLDKVNKTLLNHWTKFGRKVLYCVKQNMTKNHCRLNYSPTIMIVSCFSFFKCVCIVRTAFTFRNHPEATLCTLGDAISSYLENPDPETKSFGVAPKATLDDNKNWRLPEIIPWHPPVSRWYSAASSHRWAFTLIVFLMALVTAIATFVSGVHGTMLRMRTHSFALALSTKFGSPNPNEFTAYFLDRTGTKGFIENVLWANYWQMIISLLYLAYNALLTCQLVAEEWSGFAKERKTLRLSHPKGIQRSSYFISLPMKYGVPLLAANATLHWLVSQSLFLVNTTTYFPNEEEDTSNSYVTTGYSISATFASICFGITMIIIFLLNSLRKLPPGMPLVSTSSLAISAACHRPARDAEAHLLPVQWGVIPSANGEPTRCSFTTYREVRRPEVGEMLLGLPPPPARTKDGAVKRWWRTVYGWCASPTGEWIQRGKLGKAYGRTRKKF